MSSISDRFIPCKAQLYPSTDENTPYKNALFNVCYPDYDGNNLSFHRQAKAPAPAPAQKTVKLWSARKSSIIIPGDYGHNNYYLQNFESWSQNSVVRSEMHRAPSKGRIMLCSALGKEQRIISEKHTVYYAVKKVSDQTLAFSCKLNRSKAQLHVLDVEKMNSQVVQKGGVLADSIESQGNLLYSGDVKGNVSIFDLREANGKARTVPHEGRISSLSASSDGKYFAVGLNKNQWKLYDVRNTNTLVYKGEAKAACKAFFSRYRRTIHILTGSMDDRIFVYSLAQNKLIQTEMLAGQASSWAEEACEGAVAIANRYKSTVHHYYPKEDGCLVKCGSQNYSRADLIAVAGIYRNCLFSLHSDLSFPETNEAQRSVRVQGFFTRFKPGTKKRSALDMQLR